jgi:hypothetical protein
VGLGTSSIARGTGVDWTTNLVLIAGLLNCLFDAGRRASHLSATRSCHELSFFQQCCLGCCRRTRCACCCCSLSSFVRSDGEGSAGFRVCRPRAHAMGSLLGEWGHQDGVGRIHWSGDGIRAVPSVEVTSSAAPPPPRSRHAFALELRSFICQQRRSKQPLDFSRRSSYIAWCLSTALHRFPSHSFHLARLRCRYRRSVSDGCEHCSAAAKHGSTTEAPTALCRGQRGLMVQLN